MESENIRFTEEKIKLLTAHLIKDTFFQVDNLVMKQYLTIAMGINLS